MTSNLPRIEHYPKVSHCDSPMYKLEHHFLTYVKVSNMLYSMAGSTQIIETGIRRL